MKCVCMCAHHYVLLSLLAVWTLIQTLCKVCLVASFLSNGKMEAASSSSYCSSIFFYLKQTKAKIVKLPVPLFSLWSQTLQQLVTIALSCTQRVKHSMILKVSFKMDSEFLGWGNMLTMVCFTWQGVDGPLSAQEQMYILYEVKLQCQLNLSSTDPTSTGAWINVWTRSETLGWKSQLWITFSRISPWRLIESTPLVCAYYSLQDQVRLHWLLTGWIPDGFDTRIIQICLKRFH